MAIANRTATVANSGATSATSVTINKPTGTSAKDFLLAEIGTSVGSSAAITTPSGWIAITPNDQSVNIGQYMFYRIADGTEASTFTFTLASSTARLSGVVNAYTGVDNSNPLAGVGQKSTATASTSITYAATTPTAETVYSILMAVTRNTTAAVTMTATSGYTVDGSTSTTATPFIGSFIQDQHTTIGLPIAALTPAASTASTSSSYSTTVLFLRPDISGATSVTSDVISIGTDTLGAPVALITTGYPEVIVAFLGATNTGTVGTFSVSDTASLSWTKVVGIDQATNLQDVEIWWAYSSSALTNDSISATNTNASGAEIQVITFVGANTSSPIGATNTAFSITSAAPSSSLTTTVNNSFVAGFIVALSSAALTAGTGNVAVSNNKLGVSTMYGKGIQQTAVTPSSGTSVTVNATAPSAAYAMAIAEILPTGTAVVATGDTFLMMGV